MTETARHGDDDDGVSRSHDNLVHRFAPSGCIDSRVIKKKQEMSCTMFANQECHARFDTPLSDRSEICLLQRKQDVICNPVLKHT